MKRTMRIYATAGVRLGMLVFVMAGPVFAAPATFQGLGDLAGGGFNSEAYGVSADGSTVVGHGTSASDYEAFRWTSGGGMVGLGDLDGGSFYSYASGVSADGSTVVGWSNSALGDEAFIWDTASGMQRLQDVLVNDHGLDLTGWRLDSANGISDDGLTIVGKGYNPSGYHEAWIATIPEPVTLSLLALGGLALLRRRRLSS